MSLPAESSPRSRTWPASLNATSVTTTALPSPSSGPTVTPHAVLVLIPFHMLQATRIKLRVGRSTGCGPSRLEFSGYHTLEQIAHFFRLWPVVGQFAVEQDYVGRHLCKFTATRGVR